MPVHASVLRLPAAIQFLTLAHFAENATQAGVLQQCTMHVYSTLQKRPDGVHDASS